MMHMRSSSNRDCVAAASMIVGASCGEMQLIFLSTLKCRTELVALGYICTLHCTYATSVVDVSAEFETQEPLFIRVTFCWLREVRETERAARPSSQNSRGHSS